MSIHNDGQFSRISRKVKPNRSRFRVLPPRWKKKAIYCRREANTAGTLLAFPFAGAIPKRKEFAARRGGDNNYDSSASTSSPPLLKKKGPL